MGKKRNQSKSISTIFYSKMFFVLLIVLIVVISLGYTRAFYQDYKIKQEIAALKDEIRGLETNKLESLEILEYVMSDAYVEEKARTSLNMKAPGEKVMLLPTVDTSDNIVQKQKEPVERSHLNNPIKWWYYFTHRELPEISK